MSLVDPQLKRPQGDPELHPRLPLLHRLVLHLLPPLVLAVIEDCGNIVLNTPGSPASADIRMLNLSVWLAMHVTMTNRKTTKITLSGLEIVAGLLRATVNMHHAPRDIRTMSRNHVNGLELRLLLQCARPVRKES